MTSRPPDAAAGHRSGTVPGVNHEDLLDAAAIDIAAKIRRREVSAREVVDAHVARLEQQNPLLNAVVVDRYPAAKREADALDARIAREGTESLPPLAGVPCTIKEFFGVTGLPQTGGLVARRNAWAKEDAPIVRRLRDAGAIVLGVTNVPEGGLWMETENRLYGRTNNPWDVRRTPGGSSGGEGATVGCGGAAFGLGSDVGGSIRIPAAFCGTVGHKPTGRLIPNSGQFPAAEGEASAFLTPGPLTRRVRDVMPLLRILAGPDPGDPITRPMELGDPASVDLRGMVVIPVPHAGRVRVSSVMRDAVDASARALEARGAIVRDAVVPELRDGLLMWAAMLDAVSTSRYDAILADDGSGEHRTMSPFLELLVKLPLGRSSFTFPALVVAAVDQLLTRLPKMGQRFIDGARALQARLEGLIGDRGVLLHPPYTRPAPPHRQALLTPFDPTCTAVFNVLEYPVTVVPTGFDPHGMPVAVQVVSGRGKDHVTIAAAQALEDQFGGWKRATAVPAAARASARTTAA